MGKFLLACFCLLVLVSAVMALLKGLALVAAMVIGMMLLAGLYRLRPTAFYAVCIVVAIAYLPKAVWPWIGIAVLVWLAMEVVHAIHTRVRRPKVLRLPSA